MFDILKKKLSNFIGNIVQKKEEETKEPLDKKPEPKKFKEKPKEEVKEKPESKKQETSESKPKKAEDKPKEKKPEVKEKPKEEVKEKPEKKSKEKIALEKSETTFIKDEIIIEDLDEIKTIGEEDEKPQQEVKSAKIKKEKKRDKPKEKEEKKVESKPFKEIETKEESIESVEEPEPKPILPISDDYIEPEISDLDYKETDVIKYDISEKQIEDKPSKFVEEKKPEKKIKLDLFKKVTSILTKKITISQKDIEEYLDMLELELLEADVAYIVSQEIILKIKESLVGAEIPKDKLHEEVAQRIKQALIDVMDMEGPDVFEEAKSREKPVKILFIGPNGAGKTTTIAKFTYHFQKQNNSVLLCAADTFRAAAIEQLEIHGSRLNVPVIKSKYGADPASVGFDAVNNAKSKKIDVVLIDSAGRQDTNHNLMEELRKINRIVKPDFVIYIGEAVVGNAIVEQINNFKEIIPIDGVVLTKLDCDAKGGSALSVAYGTGTPIIYIGTGQKYENLERFDAKTIVGRMI